jgi:chorismate mutase/prephenate dehydratase
MTLDQLRQKIDLLDTRLVRILNQRAALALKIGAEKRRCGAPLLDPTRERQVLARIRKSGKGPLAPEHLEAVYEVIINKCTQVQARTAFGEKRAHKRKPA